MPTKGEAQGLGAEGLAAQGGAPALLRMGSGVERSPILSGEEHASVLASACLVMSCTGAMRLQCWDAPAVPVVAGALPCGVPGQVQQEGLHEQRGGCCVSLSGPRRVAMWGLGTLCRLRRRMMTSSTAPCRPCTR